MSNGCLFCAIAAGEIPSSIVCESENLVAFLDIQPIREGHTLIVPREHHTYFDDMPPALAAEIVAMGQRIAKAQKALYGVPRVGFLFSGVDVPHVHGHVVPMHETTDVTSRRFIVEEKLTFRPPPRATPEELGVAAQKLKTVLTPAS